MAMQLTTAAVTSRRLARGRCTSPRRARRGGSIPSACAARGRPSAAEVRRACRRHAAPAPRRRFVPRGPRIPLFPSASMVGARCEARLCGIGRVFASRRGSIRARAAAGARKYDRAARFQHEDRSRAAPLRTRAPRRRVDFTMSFGMKSPSTRSIVSFVATTGSCTRRGSGSWSASAPRRRVFSRPVTCAG